MLFWNRWNQESAGRIYFKISREKPALVETWMDQSETLSLFFAETNQRQSCSRVPQSSWSLSSTWAEELWVEIGSPAMHHAQKLAQKTSGVESRLRWTAARLKKRSKTATVACLCFFSLRTVASVLGETAARRVVNFLIFFVQNSRDKRYYMQSKHWSKLQLLSSRRSLVTWQIVESGNFQSES